MVAFTAFVTAALAVQTLPAQQRMNDDVAAGRPLVAHLHVALADNKNQGIVPVHDHLGQGDNPRTNLYWGALYGVKTFLPKHGWTKVMTVPNPRDGVLERLIFTQKIRRGSRSARVYVVADAWDGGRIEDTIRATLRQAAGHDPELIDVQGQRIEAGGSAHVIAYAGHNGLMEYRAPAIPARSEDAAPNATIVLACVSKSFFEPLLVKAGTRPLLLTTSLLAPEAYTIDAALKAWFSGGSPDQVYRDGADAYCRYQKCARRVGRSMFWAAPEPRSR